MNKKKIILMIGILVVCSLSVLVAGDEITGAEADDILKRAAINQRYRGDLAAGDMSKDYWYNMIKVVSDGVKSGSVTREEAAGALDYYHKQHPQTYYDPAGAFNSFVPPPPPPPEPEPTPTPTPGTAPPTPTAAEIAAAKASAAAAAAGAGASEIAQAAAAAAAAAQAASEGVGDFDMGGMDEFVPVPIGGSPEEWDYDAGSDSYADDEGSIWKHDEEHGGFYSEDTGQLYNPDTESYESLSYGTRYEGYEYTKDPASFGGGYYKKGNDVVTAGSVRLSRQPAKVLQGPPESTELSEWQKMIEEDYEGAKRQEDISPARQAWLSQRHEAWVDYIAVRDNYQNSEKEYGVARAKYDGLEDEDPGKAAAKKELDAALAKKDNAKGLHDVEKRKVEDSFAASDRTFIFRRDNRWQKFWNGFRENFANFRGAIAKGRATSAGFSGFSSAFADSHFMDQWHDAFDPMFNNHVLGGVDWWVTDICKRTGSLRKTGPQDNILYVDGGGQPQQAVFANGERSVFEHPNGSIEYLYKLTYYVNIPAQAAQTTLGQTGTVVREGERMVPRGWFNVFVVDEAENKYPLYVDSLHPERQSNLELKYGASALLTSMKVFYSKRKYEKIVVEFYKSKGHTSPSLNLQFLGDVSYTYSLSGLGQAGGGKTRDSYSNLIVHVDAVPDVFGPDDLAGSDAPGEEDGGASSETVLGIANL